ncbi:MAG: PaaI family thioesterase [Coprococcus sp.]
MSDKKEVSPEKIINTIEKLRDDKGFIKNIGVEYMDFGEGKATGRLKLIGSMRNPYGQAHGGCIFSLADTIGGIAAMTRGSYVTTMSASVEYLKPAKDTEYIYAEAVEIKNGRTVSVYDVYVRDDAKSNIARVTLSYYKLTPIE